MYSDSFKLYTTRAPLLRFKLRGYRIFILHDNNLLANDFDKTNLKVTDAKQIFIPRIKTKFGLIQTQQIRTLYQQNTPLLPYIALTLLPNIKANAYIDVTPALNILKYKLKTLNKQFALSNFDYIINQTDKYIKDKSKTIALFFIDTDKDLIVDYKQSFIGLLSFYLRLKKTLPFNQIFLGVIGSKGTIYRKIYDEKDGARNNYRRMINIYNEYVLANIDKFSLIKTVSNIITEKLDTPKQKADSLATVIVQNTSKDKVIELIKNEEESENETKEAVIGLKKHTFETKPTITQVATKLTKKLSGKKALSITKPELAKAEIKTLIHKVPETKLVNITNKLATSIKEFNLSPILHKGVVIKNVNRPIVETEFKQLVEHYTPPNMAIKNFKLYDDPSDKEKQIVKITLVTTNNHVIASEFKIPKIDKKGVFHLYGNKYMIAKQLSPLPIVKYKDNEVMGTSLIAFLKLIKRKSQFKYYLLFNNFLKLPLFIYLGAITDIKNVIKRLKGTYKEEGDILIVNRTNSLLKELFIYQRIKSDREYYINTLEKLIGNKLLTHYLVHTLPKQFMDIRTKSLLKIAFGGKINTFVDFLLFMFIKLIKDQPSKPNDFRTRYINTTDNVYKIIFFELSSALNKASLDVISGKTPEKLDINESAILNKLLQTADRLEDAPNPVSELSHINKITYSGFGTFTSDDTPKNLRDVHESHKGVVDPIKTSKGAAVGNQLYLTINPNVLTDNNLLEPTDDESSYLTYSTKLVPFLESSATARLNMGCAHTDQAGPVLYREPPLIQSGMEGTIFNITSNKFKTESPVSGTVIDVSNEYIIIKDENGYNHKINLFKGDLETPTGLHLLNQHAPLVKKGDKIKIGDTIAENYAFKNGVLSLGVNALCAFSFYNSQDFEDGIILSDDAATKFMFQKVNVYKIELNSKQDAVNVLKTERGPLTKDEILLDVNTSSNVISHYEQGSFKLRAKANENFLLEVIIKAKSQKAIDQLFSYTKNKINKTNIKIKLMDSLTQSEVILIIKTLMMSPAETGDKIANKHGNKGVITYIIPKDKTPYVKTDGRKIDMFINPIGLFNRANWGQMKELLTTAILYEISRQFYKKYDKNKQKAIDWYCEETAKLTKLKNFKNMLKTYFKSLKQTQIDNLVYLNKSKNRPLLPIVIPPFKAINYRELTELAQSLKLKKKVYLPELNKEIEVIVGYIYFMRLIHTPDVKLNARSTGTYTYKTHQPVAGRKLAGGQRIDEMTTWCLLAHDAKNIITEIKTVLSDDVTAKHQVLDSIINNKEVVLNNITTKAVSDNVFKALLTGLHISL